MVRIIGMLHCLFVDIIEETMHKESEMVQRDLHKMLLGEILISNKNITKQQLETALEAFQRSGKLLGEILIGALYIVIGYSSFRITERISMQNGILDNV